MKKVTKILLCIMCTFLGLAVVIWLCFSYVVHYKKTICDTSVSPDGTYELTLQAIGEPDWPFGSAKGRLVLEKDEVKISQEDFELRNDGGPVDSSCWKVTWHEEYAEVILSGEEQADVQIRLSFDGTKESKEITGVE